MEIFIILFIGSIGGFLLCIISVLFINSINSEHYPLGAFLPSLLSIFDLGDSSQLVKIGCLIIGGLFGYYLFLFLLKGRKNISLNNNLIKKENTDSIIRGKKISDFL